MWRAPTRDQEVGPPAEDAANLLEKGGGEKETLTQVAEQSKLDLDQSSHDYYYKSKKTLIEWDEGTENVQERGLDRYASSGGVWEMGQEPWDDSSAGTKKGLDSS